jgi:very-short-patch-repair endonuclease
MSALLDAASSDKRTAHGDRRRIAQQRVDYVVCTKSCEVVAVVELDDKTHSRAKDQLRDARLEQGRIRTVRFQARSKPGVEAIRAMVLGSASAEVNKVPGGTADPRAATPV